MRARTLAYRNLRRSAQPVRSGGYLHCPFGHFRTIPLRPERPRRHAGAMAITAVPYLIDLQQMLSDDERLVWRSAADFMRERVQPIIADCYERAVFPRELIPELARMGFLGA